MPRQRKRLTDRAAREGGGGSHTGTHCNALPAQVFDIGSLNEADRDSRNGATGPTGAAERGVDPCIGKKCASRHRNARTTPVPRRGFKRARRATSSHHAEEYSSLDAQPVWARRGVCSGCWHPGSSAAPATEPLEREAEAFPVLARYASAAAAAAEPLGGGTGRWHVKDGVSKGHVRPVPSASYCRPVRHPPPPPSGGAAQAGHHPVDRASGSRHVRPSSGRKGADRGQGGRGANAIIEQSASREQSEAAGRSGNGGGAH